MTCIIEKLKHLRKGANVDELLENEIIEKSAEKVENEIQSIFRETEISKKPLVNGEEGEEICDNKDNGDENSTPIMTNSTWRYVPIILPEHRNVSSIYEQ